MMDDQFFIQGTGNRILWIFDKVKDLIEDVDMELAQCGFFWGIHEMEENQREMERLADLLMNVRYLPQGVILLSFEA